jgi:hypothetical protein
MQILPKARSTKGPADLFTGGFRTLLTGPAAVRRPYLPRRAYAQRLMPLKRDEMTRGGHGSAVPNR